MEVPYFILVSVSLVVNFYHIILQPCVGTSAVFLHPILHIYVCKVMNGSPVFHISICVFSGQFLSHNSSAMCWDISSFPTNVETRIICLNQSKVD